MVEDDVVVLELAGLPEVEYPDDVVDRWEKEAEIAMLKLATGELKPMTAAQMAAERGLTLD
jgi:hypothetical protein